MNRKTLCFLAGAFGLLLCLDACIFRGFLSFMYPYGDELALKAATLSDPISWFRKGFSDYFVAYPEWFRPFTNFLRPLVNLTYFLFRWDETGAWQLVMVNHVIHVCITLGLFQLARACGRSVRWSMGIGLAAFLAPGFGATIMPIAPAFAFDGLVALLALLGLFAIARARVLLGLLLLFLATLTKEAALPVVATVLLFGALTRHRGLMLGAAAILLCWIGLRYSAFGSVLGGVYVYGDGALAHGMLKKFLRPHVLPFGASQVFYYPTFVGEGDRHVLREFYQVFTVVLLGVMLRQLKPIGLWRQSSSFSSKNETNATAQLFLMAALSSILYLVLIGSEARFAYAATVLTLAWLASGLAVGRLGACLLAGMVVGGGVLSIAYTSTLLRSIDMQRTCQISSRELIRTLQRYPEGGAVFTVADFSSRYASGAYIRRYAGVNREVGRGLSLDVERCTVDQLAQVRTEVTRLAAGSLQLEVTLPDCAAFTWEAAVPALLAASLHDGVLVRNPHLQYAFPGMQIIEDERGVRRVTGFGQRAVLTMTGASALVYRPAQQLWDLVE